MAVTEHAIRDATTLATVRAGMIARAVVQGLVPVPAMEPVLVLVQEVA